MVPIKPEISARISLIRFAMIAGIVLLHTPPHVPFSEVPAGVFPFIKAFMAEALFRATVPMLTCISGYLLFSAGLDQRTSELLTKKTRTLLLPFLLWNVPFIPVLYAAQSHGFLTGLSIHVDSLDPDTFIEKTFMDPVNYPLVFLRDLLVLCVLAPLIGAMIRKAPWTGLSITAVVFLFNLDGPLLLRDPMAVNFYLGGMAAIHHWDLTRFDRYAPLMAVALVAGCTAMVLFDIEDLRLFSIAAPIAIWPISALLIHTRLGDLCRRLAPSSFFVFLSHALVLPPLWFAYQRYPIIPYELFWVSAPLLTIAICILSRALLKRLMFPEISVVLGAR